MLAAAGMVFFFSPLDQLTEQPSAGSGSRLRGGQLMATKKEENSPSDKDESAAEQASSHSHRPEFCVIGIFFTKVPHSLRTSKHAEQVLMP